MFLRAPEAVVQLRCVSWERNHKAGNVLGVSGGTGRMSSFVFLLTPASKPGVAGGHCFHLSCSLCLPACPHRTALSPQKMLRQEVRQFVYWQISAETHEPHKHRCSVPCYIRMVTIPLGKVQKINKQAKLVLTYPGEGCEQSLVQVSFSSIQLEWKTCDTSSGSPLGEL